MNAFVLRVEGVNFNQCLFDTNNLAVIRGASLMFDSVATTISSALCKALGREIAPDWAGGSKAAFSFDATPAQAEAAEVAVRAALGAEPWRHLTWVLDIAEGEQAEMLTEARNRARQFRQWTVANCHVAGAWRQDSLDGLRPADPKITDAMGALSPASVARRNYGRDQRRNFFQQRAGEALNEDVVFCDDFSEIVAPTNAKLSDSARSKIAVLHLDGDGFGKIVTAAGGPAAFAREYGALSQKLLAALVEHALGLEEQELNHPATRLRMEALLWGGDDMTLVVPGWRALDTINAFYNATQSWEIAGNRLSFTCGAVVAHQKAPIRLLRALAEEAVTLNKAAGPGNFSIDIFESASPPEDGLQMHRARVHPDIGADVLSFPGAQSEALSTAVRRYVAEAGTSYPSRAVLHRHLQSNLPEAELMVEIARYEHRVVGRAREDTPIDLTLPGGPRSLGLDLRLILDLWDYVP